MKQSDILDYEVRSSWWTGLTPYFLHGLAAAYFAWKVNRKWKRYLYSLESKRFVDALCTDEIT